MKRKKLNIFALFSGGASLADHLISNDKDYNATYQFMGAMTDKKEASGVAKLVKAGIPVLIQTLRPYLDTHETKEAAKVAFFNDLAEHIEKIEPKVDLILLCGFMKLIPVTFIARFPQRIINVHPADLRIKDLMTHKRIYTGPGIEVIKGGLANGVKEMRSTMHFAVPEPDEGMIISVSPPYPIIYSSGQQLVPSEIQDAMKDTCDGPAGIEAMRKLYTGEVSLGITALYRKIINDEKSITV